MNLKIEDGGIIEAEDGSFSAPADTETPIRLERFRISTEGDIELNPIFTGLTNAELEIKILSLREEEEFDSKVEKTIRAIWSLLTDKEMAGKKAVRGKEEMEDRDFIELLEKDARKLKSATEGLDVFPMQASILGVTQADIRASIISKASEYENSTLLLEDKLEGVRRALELECSQATTEEALAVVGLKVKKLNKLSIDATTADIAAILLS